MNLSLDEYLKRMIDTYLFGDLDKMTTSEIGYPSLMATFAGIEFLGGLIDPKPFRKGAGADYFKNYWSLYLYPNHPHREAEADAVYKLVRHGIAHCFVPKGPIGVGEMMGRHLKRLASNNLLVVDPVELYTNFKTSYLGPFQDLLKDSVKKASMSKQLQLMHTQYDDDYEGLGVSAIFGAVPEDGSRDTFTPETTQAPRPAVSSSQGPTGPR